MNCILRRTACTVWIILFFVYRPAITLHAAEPTVEQREFFERRIRPLLVERCFACHSSESEKLKGGLRLDSLEGLLKGGETGPAVVPGHPNQSRLIEAVGYDNVDLQMPPKAKLPEAAIEDLTTWVQSGAPWPREAPPSLRSKETGFDLAERRRTHWAWQPIQRPRIPDTLDSSWPRGIVDQFLLAKLEAQGLKPAPPADPRTWLRRLSFALIGLPPTPEEVNSFTQDSGSKAPERAVDRLLNSPHFGERWARHWLDLVRYAETLGHEFDYAIPNAWKYRDYIIRALNADLPYPDLVREHIAGDLLEPPRRHPAEGFNESIIGTGFFWFTQQVHSPVDVGQNQADLIDNQIDVLTKTFLGLTVSCARCHDHKFDAISTRDFYGLYGILSSSRYQQAAVDPPDRLRPTLRQLSETQASLRTELARTWTDQAQQVARSLLAIRAIHDLPESGPALDTPARSGNLEAGLLSRWRQALDSAQASPGSPNPFFAWIRLNQARDASVARAGAESFAERFKSEIPQATPSKANVPSASAASSPWVDFTQTGFDGWGLTGEAFGDSPSRLGDLTFGFGKEPALQLVERDCADSGRLSRRLEGVLRSPTFSIEKRFIHLRAAGRDSRVNVVIDNFLLIRDPIYGGLKRSLNSDVANWTTFDVETWKGHRAYLEFSDTAVGDLSDSSRGGNGYITVQSVHFSDDKRPPGDSGSIHFGILFGDEPVVSQRALAERYQQIVLEALAAWEARSWADDAKATAQIALLNWMIQKGLLKSTPTSTTGANPDRLTGLLRDFARIESSLTSPDRVPAMTDGTGLDERVFIRGNPKNRGETAPRRFLEALDGNGAEPIGSSCGRLELARRVTAPENPFLARVMVNRVWHHLFGLGLVPSVDNFGVLGERPTHPELLDWLADWYRTEAGWSTKKLIRLLVTSRAFAMSSAPTDPVAEERDPANTWLHRMRVLRLEGEAIRDSLLFVSGRLDQTMFGPSVPVHLTPFMEGRGRPGQSGPLDGSGRRSVYVEVRRNFLSPMMLAYDTPTPFTTVGRRSASNVPAQALTLMNDPFVLEQAEALAKRLLAEPLTEPGARIQRLFRIAFGRPPTNSEASDALAFLSRQAATYGVPPSQDPPDDRVWRDLCHVIFNVKEFVFIH